MTRKIRVKESKYIDCMYDFFRLSEQDQELTTRNIKVIDVTEMKDFCLTFKDENGLHYWMFAYAQNRYSKFLERIKTVENSDHRLTVSLFPNITDNFVIRVE